MSAEPPSGEDQGTPPEPPPAEPPPAAPGEDGSAGPDDGAAPVGEDSAPPVCSVCGTPLAADQTYCLECGAPTPLAPALRRARRTGALVAAVIGVLVIAVVVLAAALASRGDSAGSPPGPTVTGTAPFPTADLTISTGTPPFATSTSLPPDTSATVPTAPVDTSFTTPPASTPSPSADDWPSGRSAWTAVVSSVRSLAEATATKARVQATGQPAGVLTSSDFSTLRPGYYVVFSGIFGTQALAAAQARRLATGFPGAYPRRVAP